MNPPTIEDVCKQTKRLAKLELEDKLLRLAKTIERLKTKRMRPSQKGKYARR